MLTTTTKLTMSVHTSTHYFLEFMYGIWKWKAYSVSLKMKKATSKTRTKNCCVSRVCHTVTQLYI